MNYAYNENGLKIFDALFEHAIARKGDWEYDGEHIDELSYFMYSKFWELKGYLKIGSHDLQIIKHTKENIWRLGLIKEKDEEIKHTDKTEKIKYFESYMFLEMENSKNLGFKISVKPLYRAKMVGVDSSFRGIGIAKSMYKYLVKEQKYNIIGDVEQFFGARRLWANLSRSSDVIVDIVDIKKGIYVEKDTILHHGTDDWDFDKRVWDYSNHLEDIRLILKDIN